MTVEAIKQAAERRDAARLAEAQAADELAQAIREAKGSGVPLSEIQEAAGITRQRVWQIINGAR